MTTARLLLLAVAAGPLLMGAAPGADAPKKERGWFGISLKAATPEEQAKLGVTVPVPRVTKVFGGSPAQNSGVRVGDYVLAFDGQDVQSVKDLVTRVGAKPPGTEVDVRLWTSGERRVLRVSLDLYPDLRALARKEQLGKPLPELVLEGLDGEALTLGGEAGAGRGTVWVLDYFTTWCGPCKRVLPQLSDLQETYAARGVRVVGVTAEDRPTLSPYADKMMPSYRLALDPAKGFAKELSARVLPTLWVVDADGVIVEVLYGSGKHEALVAAVEKALAGQNSGDGQP